MIHGLFKSKRVDEAMNLLREMLHKNMVPNAVTYNSLIDDLCKSGRLTSALDLMEKEMHPRGQAAEVVIKSSVIS